MGKIFEAFKRSEGEDPKFTSPETLEPIKVEAAPMPDESEQIVADAIERAVSGTAAAPADDARTASLPEEPEPTEPARFEPASIETSSTETVSVEPAAAGAEAVFSFGIRKFPIQLMAGAPVLPFDTISPRAGEQYRIVRTKLLHHPKQPRICLIASPGPGDGKTITAINLAGALALSENKVVLVDADLRRSSVAHVLGLPAIPGLADVLAGKCELDDALIEVKQLSNLYVIPAGKPHTNPTELLDSERWLRVCTELRQRFRFSILDVPPIVGIADFEVMQSACDGVVLVVRPDHTDRNICFKALEMIPKEKMLGVTLNCVSEWFLWKSNDYSQYYHSEVSKGLGLASQA
jgi:protein-tyrosine kinase